MRIGLGADHRGFYLKEHIKGTLELLKCDYIDYGTNDDNPVDYPDITVKVIEGILTNKCERGILICATGIGMSITANRFPKIRAALCMDLYAARLSRAHNDSNVLVIGADFVGKGLASEIVKVWIETPFEGDRHARRLYKIQDIESLIMKYYKGE